MLGKRKIIALCISKVHDTTSYEFVVALNEKLRQRGDSLFVYNTCSDLYWGRLEEKGEMSVFDLMPYQIIDAVIIFEEKIKDEQLVGELVSRVAAHDIPAIIVGNAYQGCAQAVFDYQEGFANVIRHVIHEHHVTRLHLMSGLKGNPFSDSRQNVFQRVLQENGIEYDEQSMVSYGDFWSDPTRIATERLIERGELPEALICANDTMAIVSCNVLKKHGYSIPEDIIVTGFDGIDDIKFSAPTITSCVCSYNIMAENVCDMLYRYFEEGILESRRAIMPSMVLAESCGCKGAQTINASEYVNVLNDRLNYYLEKEMHLAGVTARINNCKSIEEVCAELKKSILPDMCCLLRADSIDECVNPLQVPQGDVLSEKLCLVYDSEAGEGFTPCDFDAGQLVPDLQGLLERGKPLIFIALNFLNIPLGYICFHFKDYAAGNYYRVPQDVTSMNNAIGGYRNMRYQHYLAKQIEEMYRQDILIGLYNRNGLMAAYQEMVSDHGQEKISEGITIVLADLDGLKKINDNYGHGEGDHAIHTVAQALKNACPKNAVCARFGGDEMLAIFDEEYDPDLIKKDITAYLDSYNSTSGKPYVVAASVGIYKAERGSCLDIEELMKRADELMYAEKLAKKVSR